MAPPPYAKRPASESAQPESEMHHIVQIPAGSARARLDKAVADALAGRPGLSRSRIARLIADGHLARADGSLATDPAERAAPGATYTLAEPPPEPAEPQAEAIPLAIAFEDEHLLVVDKPAGMVVHPAPGSPTGTLVNALIAHCGESLKGIGGERRPGIVHRIDKDTSGLLVIAKTQAAHEGLAAQFADKSAARRYDAVLRGAPSRADPRLVGLPGVTLEREAFRIETLIDRHRTDRTRMAVSRSTGRRAVTRLTLVEPFHCGTDRAVAALASARLETGRTHQIRVHAAHIGHPLIGDPVYARQRPWPTDLEPEAAAALSGFARQALHAAELGFTHPASGQWLDFAAPMPADMMRLLAALRRKPDPIR